MNPIIQQDDKFRAKFFRARGIVLMLTMVVLIILAILGYTLSSRVAAQRHRYNYIIDYTTACYARDSALKYALSGIEDMNNFRLISRPNEPDFSDLFAMSDADYCKLLENWAADIIKRQTAREKEDESWRTSFDSNQRDLNELGFNRDINAASFLHDSNIAPTGRESNAMAIRDLNSKDSNHPYASADTNIAGPNVASLAGLEPNLADPNLLTVPGPYGAAWPYVTEPVELEIGDCRVKIEIEDENAKLPAGWSVLEGEKYKREADASVSTFCEWMGFGPDRITELKKQFKEVRDIKPFKIEFQPQSAKVQNKNAAVRPTRGNRQARQTPTYTNVTLSPAQQISKQARDFSRLLHSSVIDTDMLARPTIVSEKRKESALKYMSLWGTTQVNINTAPRQVLEAAFTFGGQAPRIADEIIKKRKEMPFESIDQLKTNLLSYSDNIEKCTPFINTASNVFTIHVTATCGTAKASAVVVVVLTEGKSQTVAIMCG
jgi:hypothetical protein